MNQAGAGSGGRPAGTPRGTSSGGRPAGSHRGGSSGGQPPVAHRAAGSGARPPGTPRTRARKLGDRIAEIVAEMLERRIKDPRLGFVTVTEARVTGDLREATVYYTVYGSPDEVAGTRAALASATGLIRSEVGRQTGLKHTPSISFSEDTVPDTARTIEDLVERARAADAAVAAARDGALPAGDPDPYRVPSEDDRDEDQEDEDLDGEQ